MDDSEEVERLVKDAQKAFRRLLRNERDLIIQKIKDAPDIPTMVLLEAKSLRMIQKDNQRNEIPDPPFEFEKWVTVNILDDSEEQLSFWVEEERDWMETAAVTAGKEAFISLGVEKIFNARDEKLLRWIQERSLRSASLIKGVTDEDVLMTLWDVVYEGNYSIKKFSDALKESFAFSDQRAEVIARTEVISASRAGQYHGDLQSGIVIGKKWRSALQERTRQGHREADGQIVALDEPFLVANGKGQLEPLLFPGDSSLGAGPDNTIQCRCWYYRILEGEEMK